MKGKINPHIYEKQLYLEGLLLRKEALLEAKSLNNNEESNAQLKAIETRIVVIVELLEQNINDEIAKYGIFNQPTEIKELIKYKNSIKYYHPDKYILTANGTFKNNPAYISPWDHNSNKENNASTGTHLKNSLLSDSGFISSTSLPDTSFIPLTQAARI